MAGLTAPEGPGDAAKLTLYCRAGERANGRAVSRAAVDVLRRGGAAGAIVLRGVDGAIAGRRGRARLFGANGDAPMTIISVGPPEPLRACLPALAALVAEPVVTFEAVARVKHDGEHLEPPSAPARAAAERGRLADDPRLRAPHRARPRPPAVLRAHTPPADRRRGGRDDDPRRLGVLQRRAPPRRPLRPDRQPPPDVHRLHRPPRPRRGGLAAHRRRDGRARPRHVARRPRLPRARRGHGARRAHRRLSAGGRATPPAPRCAGSRSARAAARGSRRAAAPRTRSAGPRRRRASPPRARRSSSPSRGATDRRS